MRNPALLIAVLLLSSCGDSPKDRMLAFCAKKAERERAEGYLPADLTASELKLCNCLAEKLDDGLEAETYEKLVDRLEEESDKDNAKINLGKIADKDTGIAFFNAAQQCSKR